MPIMVRRSFVVARDPDAGMILLGGLGGLGVGEMWFEEKPYMREKEGYAEAPVRKYLGGTLPAERCSVHHLN